MSRTRTASQVALFLIAVFAACASSAQQPDVFTVSGVAVDQRAADELSAKAVGIAGAKQRALDILLRRLTLEADHGRLPSVDATTLESFLQDFSVGDEKFGGGRYLASITARFRPDAVRGLLDRAGLAYAETPSRPILILPVYGGTGSPVLWDDPNPWFDAWTQLRLGDGLLSFVMPLGDLADVTTISAEQALAMAPEPLAAVARKYGASSVLVAAATVDGASGAGARALVATGSLHGMDLHVPDVVEGIGAQPDAATLARAAATMRARIEDAWKRRSAVRRGEEAVLTARVPIVEMADWLAVRRRLETVATVKQVDVVRLSRAEAQVRITFAGSPSQLNLAMAESELDLAFSPVHEEWVLEPSKRR